MSLQRRLAVFATVLCTLLLSSCLLRVAYNNADWLLVWQLDSSFDLTRPQKEFLSERLREHLRWHRATELERTIAFLRRTQSVATDGVSKSELEAAVVEFNTLRNTLATRLAADGVEFFAQVSDEQLDYLKNSLMKANKDSEKRVKLPPPERSAERTERVLDIVTDWIGPLSSAQQQQLTPSIEHIPDVLEIWLTHTKERQRQFVELVRASREDRAAASRAFVAWVSAETTAPELNIHRAAVYDLILEIDALCTQKQKEHFNHKLQDWIDDLQRARTQGAA